MTIIITCCHHHYYHPILIITIISVSIVIVIILIIIVVIISHCGYDIEGCTEEAQTAVLSTLVGLRQRLIVTCWC